MVATLDIRGLVRPMEVTLFIRNGYLFSIGGQTAPYDDTSVIDFGTVRFTVRRPWADFKLGHYPAVDYASG